MANKKGATSKKPKVKKEIKVEVVERPRKAKTAKPQSYPNPRPMQEVSRTVSKYLYGFVDPEHPGRGPSEGTQPTMVSTFRSTASVKILANDGLTTAYPASSAVVMNAAGTIGICCGYNEFVNYSAAVPHSIAAGNVLPAAGFFFDPTDKVVTASQMTKATTEARTVPFGTWDTAFPHLAAYGSTTTIQTASDGGLKTTYRTVGLRSTITVDTPSLTAAGHVYCGNNNTYLYENKRPKYRAVLGMERDYIEPPITDHFSTSFKEGRNSAHMVNAGAFANGVTYEATFLPTGEQGIEYRDFIPFSVYANPTGSSNDTLVDPWLNGPRTFFVLTGLAADSVVTISTSWAVEWHVDQQNVSTGFMRNMARVNPPLTLPFGTEVYGNLSCCPPGGVVGDCARSCAGKACLCLGVAMAAGVEPDPPYVKPKAQGIGALSATTLLLHGAGVSSRDGVSLSDGMVSAARKQENALHPGFADHVMRGLKGLGRGVLDFFKQGASGMLSDVVKAAPDILSVAATLAPLML